LEHFHSTELAKYFWSMFRMVHSELMKENPAETFKMPKQRADYGSPGPGAVLPMK